MKIFFGNVSWSFGAGLLSAVIMFSVNILAGRLLGPFGFGQYNFILSLATSVTFFFLLGNNQSGIRYIADDGYRKRRGGFLSALLFLTIAQTIVVLALSNAYSYEILKKFGISLNIFRLTLFLGLVFSFKELFDSFIRSLGLFKVQSFIKVGDAIFVLVSFMLFYFIYRAKLSPSHYAMSMAVGAIFSISAFFYFVKDRFERFGRGEISILFRYNKFLILGGLSGLIMSLEKVFIGKYIGIESLGIYSAYYASSQMIISNFGIIFMNIFWPTVIKNKDSLGSILAKLTKVFFRYFPLWVAMNFACIAFFLSLYGKQYALDVQLLVLFSLSSLLNVFFFVFMSIMNIDKVHLSFIINTVLYVVLVSSIAIFRSIPIYLAFQVALYLVGIIYVRGVLIRDVMRKTL